jgi:hypothetical protein
MGDRRSCVAFIKTNLVSTDIDYLILKLSAKERDIDLFKDITHMFRSIELGSKTLATL